MKNITVSVPDDVYRDAKIRAAERGTSVSALVAEYLRSLSEHKTDLAQARAQWREVRAGINRFSASDRLSRDELNDRPLR